MSIKVLVTFKIMMMKWTDDLGSYQEQTQKVVTQTNSQKKNTGVAALKAISFVAFILLPQVWGMRTPFIGSRQASRADKGHITVTQCKLELSNGNSAAGQCTWSPFSQHPTDLRASGTAGHITICTPGNEPLTCCSLFMQDFQGNRLPRLK